MAFFEARRYAIHSNLMLFRVASEEERTLRRDLDEVEPTPDSSSEEFSFWRYFSTEQSTEYYVNVYSMLLITVICIALLR